MDSFSSRVPICFITDKKYCFSVAAAIVSVLENSNENIFYDIFCIVGYDVDKSDKEKILSISKNYDNCSIRILEAGDSYRDKVCKHVYISNASLYKFLIPELLPQYDKVLYIDTDVIVNEDLSSLYNINLGANYLGAVLSLYHYIERKKYYKRINLKDMSNYFNAGVLLMNLKLMREDNLRTQLEALIGKFDDSVDQHIFNIVCYGRVKLLPCKYNVTYTNYPIYKSKKHTELFFMEKEIDEAVNSPVIFHYTGSLKPWQYKDLPFSLRWYEYYLKSPYKDCPLLLVEMPKRKKTSLLAFLKRQVALFLNIFIKTNKCQGRSYIDSLIQRSAYLSKLVNIIRITFNDDGFILLERIKYALKYIFSINLYKDYFVIKFFGKRFSTEANVLSSPDNVHISGFAGYSHIIDAPVSNKKVVYTCNTDNYDIFFKLSYTNPEWDYLYFTDNLELIRAGYAGGWKILPVTYYQENGILTNRFYKINPHIVLPDIYTESLYIDSNINILSNKIFEDIDNLQKNFLLQKHYARDCVFQEIDTVIDLGLDDFVRVMKLKQFLLKSKFPYHYGLTENSIIYRCHHSEMIIKLMEEWWQMLENFSHRDQLSFMYILWKNQLLPESFMIPNVRKDSENFSVYVHNKNVNLS